MALLFSRKAEVNLTFRMSNVKGTVVQQGVAASFTYNSVAGVKLEDIVR
jgi:hypothetical protein